MSNSEDHPGRARGQRPGRPGGNGSGDHHDGPNGRDGDSGRKPFWDWSFLPNFLLTFLLATVGWGLAQTYVQHQSDKQDALDQQRASILQTYIDNMRDLLLTHNLAKSAPGDEARQVARVQTLTTLRSLDADRNGRVLRFLKEAHLIGAQNAIINLSNADLSNDDLSGADLSGIDLVGATLTGARLNGADLRGSDLYGADLSGAHLSDADLSNAFLFEATLTGAHLERAHLSNAILTGAFLGDTVANGAVLAGARMNGTILSGARLSGADLSSANLSGADLGGADVSGADLSDAYLGAQRLTQPQLDTAYSCTNAILSAGLTCKHKVTITLTYWYTESPAESPVIGKLIRQYEQRNPRIRIVPVKMPFFQTQAAFITRAEEGNAPDVLRSDVGWVDELASKGYLLNIDSYATQRDLQSDYLATPLKYDYYAGHLYGLPQVTDFLALLYNKATLAKAGIAFPPIAMAELEADAMQVVQQRAAQYGFETNGTGYDVLPFLWAFGGGMFGPHDHILVNSAGSVTGLNFLLQLQNTVKVMPTDVNFSNGGGNMLKDFMNGSTAMIFDGPYDVSEILTNPNSAFKRDPGNLGIAGIPVGPNGQTGSPLGGQSYVISAGTAHPLEAYKFISFMSSTASQIAIAKANHTLPTRLSAYQANGVFNDPFISAFLRITPTVVARPVIPQAGHLFDAFDPSIANVLDGFQTPTAALNAVAGAWEQLLAPGAYQGPG